jgi:hypothetical protein
MKDSFLEYYIIIKTKNQDRDLKLVVKMCKY